MVCSGWLDGASAVVGAVTSGVGLGCNLVVVLGFVVPVVCLCCYGLASMFVCLDGLCVVYCDWCWWMIVFVLLAVICWFAFARLRS